jgi:hypothetical protein
MNHSHFSPARIYLPIVICMLLNSCYTGPLVTDPYRVDESRQKENFYYVPSAPNSPLLTEKNDMNLNLVRSSSSKFAGFDIQGAYLPGKHVGIIAGYSLAESDGGYPYNMRYHRLEGGAGYILLLKNGWHLETYAGLGTGKVTNYHHTGFSKTDLTHFFIQPAFGFNNEKKTVQLGFVSRFAGVNFSVTDTSIDTGREALSAQQLKNLQDKPFHVVWEPGLVFRAGWKNVLFNLGYTYSTDLTDSKLYRANSNFSFGFSLRFNTSGKEDAKIETH